MDPLRRLAKVVTTCCQKITNPKTQLNDEVVDLERSSSDTLETAQQRQEIEQEQSAGSKESTEKTEEKRVISNHSVNTTNASDESAEHKDPVVPRLKGGVGQSQKVRKLRQQQQLAGNEKDTQQKPSDEIVQPAQASCDPKNTESERILDYWTNPDGAAKKPGVEEKKGSGEGAAKKPSVEEKRRSGEAAAKKPGVEEKKGSDEGAAKKLSVEEKKGSAELHTANSAENEEPLVLSVIEEPHLIPPLLAAGPDMKQIAQVQHVRGQEAKPVKVTHSGESVKRKGQKGSQRLKKWQKFRSGKHAESNESHVPVQDEYAQKHPSRPSSAENLPQQKDPNAQKPSSKSSSAEGIAFLKVKFRSKTPRKASAETTGQPKGSIRQKLASLRQKVDPNQQKHHSRSSSAEDFAQQKDKNSQRQHLRSSSAEGFAFAKGKFRSRTPRKMSAEMWGKGSIRQRKGSIRQKLDRHSKEAVKLKQSSGEGGSNSHDKPSKEALKSKRSSGEGGLRPQEKPSLERVHKMSAEGRLKVQEKQSLERIHRMSAEGKLKAQEKLSSGERIPKVTQDAKGNENKDLKKSPAKPTVVPVPTKETGKPLELKNSMRQQVLKSPTDKPKELKNSMRQQVLKSPTDKPKIVYKIPTQYIRSGLAKPTTPEQPKSKQPTTPEKIKSGQEQVSPFVPSKQQVASKEVVHPSKQQPAIAHQPIVPPRAAQKAASPPKANKPSVQQDPGKRPPAPRSNSPVQSVFLNVPKGYSDGCQVATASAPPQSKEQYQKDQKSFDEYICFYTQGAPQPKSS